MTVFFGFLVFGLGLASGFWLGYAWRRSDVIDAKNVKNIKSVKDTKNAKRDLKKGGK